MIAARPDPAARISGAKRVSRSQSGLGDGGVQSNRCRGGLAELAKNKLVLILAQNNSFNPNWTCRDVPDVAVITPAVGDGPELAVENTTVFGVLKLARFRRLKNSARNCILTRSVTAVLFSTEKSTVAVPGPMRVSRPTLPKVPLGGTANAVGLKYWVGLPRITGP